MWSVCFLEVLTPHRQSTCEIWSVNMGIVPGVNRTREIQVTIACAPDIMLCSAEIKHRNNESRPYHLYMYIIYKYKSIPQCKILNGENRLLVSLGRS